MSRAVVAVRGQLKRLSEAANQLRNITIQVLPFSGGAYAGMVGSFAILEFGGSAAPDVVYVEGLTSDIYAEGDDVKRYTLVFE